VRRWSKKIGDELLLFTGTTFILAYLLLYTLAGHVALFFVSEFIAGAGFVLVMSASYAHASRLIPASHRGRQFAWFNATFFLSWGIPATFIAGPIIDLLIDGGMAQTLAYRMGFVVSALLVAVGMVLLLVEHRKYREKSIPMAAVSEKS
jgi:MFS family permease